MKNMKVLIWAFLIVAFFLVGGLLIYVNYMLPNQIASTIVEDNNKNVYLPAKVKDNLRESKKIFDDKILIVDKELKLLNVTYQDLEILIDEVNPDDVIKTLEILNNTELKTADQIFDISKENIKVNHLDVEIFRDSFRRYVKVETVQKILRKIEENELIRNISVPVAKETAKQILKERKNKIERELDEINSK